jgi:hypothetical protein
MKTKPAENRDRRSERLIVSTSTPLRRLAARYPGAGYRICRCGKPSQLERLRLAARALPVNITGVAHAACRSSGQLRSREVPKSENIFILGLLQRGATTQRTHSSIRGRATHRRNTLDLKLESKSRAPVREELRAVERGRSQPPPKASCNSRQRRSPRSGENPRARQSDRSPRAQAALARSRGAQSKRDRRYTNSLLGVGRRLAVPGFHQEL